MALPKEFLDRMQSMLGGEMTAFEDSFSHTKYQALRVNTLKSSVATFKVLSKEAFLEDFEGNVPWEETGFYYPDSIRPGKHVYHEAGLYYIQEPSAMAPAHYLEARPGDFVLDLCAAPGGKSTQIACQLASEGLLISNEIHPARAKILAENIERMGIKNAIVTNETADSLALRFPACFDRIMVDAPCSGEGMFRKNEEAITQWSPENVQICADRQDEILENAHKMLRQGGRMVYSTCTFAPAENEGSIARFLQRHPEYKVLPVPRYEGMTGGELSYYISDSGSVSATDSDFDSESATGSVSVSGSRFATGSASDSNTTSASPSFTQESADAISNTIRLWPHKLKGEGHFTAVLQKGDAPLSENAEIHPVFHMAAGGYTLENGLLLLDNKKGSPKKDMSHKKEFKNGKRPKDGGKNHARTASSMEDAIAALSEFLQQSVKLKLSGTIAFFGDQMYLLPKNSPSLTGLKVLRPGLHLGSFAKDRFEPSHALALSLKPSEAMQVCDLNEIAKAFSQSETGSHVDALTLASKFINGETFSFEGNKGWYLICVDGMSIGWGRLAGNIMKNYYPKGLRKNL